MLHSSFGFIRPDAAAFFAARPSVLFLHDFYARICFFGQIM